MKCLSSIFILLFLGCKPHAIHNEVSFTFDGNSYILPNVVEKILNENEFSFGEYTGFTHESINYESVLQLERMPMWEGNDNVHEEEYKKTSVIGITFFSPLSKIDLKVIARKIEETYKVNFLHLQGCDFQYMEAKPGLFIVLSQKNDHNLISFYSGIPQKKLCEYASSVIW